MSDAGRARFAYRWAVVDLRRKTASFVLGFAALLCICGRERDARAEETVLTRQAALRLGADRGPAVLEARAPLGASPAMREAATVLPYMPRLSVFAGARHGAFGSGVEVGGTFVQDLSLHGLGRSRRDFGVSFDRAGKSELERARVEAAALAVVAWIDLLETQELVLLRHRAREEAEAIARVARARVERGVGMPIEASLADAEVGAAELAELDAEGKLFEARSAMRFAVALPASAAVRALGVLEATAPIDRDTTREHPAVAAARSQTALAAADAKLAHAQLRPPLGVGLAYAREGTGEQYVTGVVSVPLPFGDPAKFDTTRLQADVLAARAREDLVKKEIARDVTIGQHEREHTREVERALRERVLVPLREAVRVARAAYEAGTQDAMTLLITRQRLVAAEEQLQRARAEVQRADVRYAVARGTLLDEATR